LPLKLPEGEKKLLRCDEKIKTEAEAKTPTSSTFQNCFQTFNGFLQEGMIVLIRRRRKYKKGI
jgi:hypothetical protein